MGLASTIGLMRSNVHQDAAQDAAGLPREITGVLLLMAPPVRLGGCIAEVCLPANVMVRPWQGE